VPVDEIKKWSFKKFIRHLTALKKYYDLQSGSKKSEGPRIHQYHFMEMD